MSKPGESNDGTIGNITINAGILHGTIYFPAIGRSVKIQLDTETGKTEAGDFDPLIETLKDFIRYFQIDKYDELKKGISREITDSAYEQDNYVPTADDYSSLEGDLELVEISGFQEGFLLEYQAKRIFPDNFITVQLTQDFEIDDIAVNG